MLLKFWLKTRRDLAQDPTFDPALFVDDLSTDMDGHDEQIISRLNGFTELTSARIQEDGMEVSKTRSLVSAGLS